MLIQSHRHTAADLRAWREMEAADMIVAGLPGLAARVASSIAAIRRFAAAGPCYAAVSWGKDSVVLADLARLAAPDVPLAWIRVEPIANPDCEAVRDAFLATRGGRYEEITVHCRRGRDGWRATGTLETGFAEAAARFGRRYILGIRADESSGRRSGIRSLGVDTATSCRPLAWWTAGDVFARLASAGLPVHPAYAMLGGGRWERRHLRVASLGGRRGDGMGRMEWESEYYGDVLRRLEAGA